MAFSGAEVEAYVVAHIDVRDALAELLERRGVLCCYVPDLARTPEERQEVFRSAAEEIIGGLYENGWILVRGPRRRSSMDAREVLARKILWDDNPGAGPYSDDPWAGDQALHDAYLATADEYIAALDQAGYTIVRKPTGTEPTVEVTRRLLYRAFRALELQPNGTWHRDDKLARELALKDLRRALGLVYRCQTCGEWLAAEDLVNDDGHETVEYDRNDEPYPALCGPVRLVGDEVG